MDHTWYVEIMIDAEAARALSIAAFAIDREWLHPWSDPEDEYDEGGEG